MRHKYTDAEKQYISDNVKNHTYAELVEMVKRQFGVEVSAQSLSDLCSKRMKVKREAKLGRFAVGGERQSHEVGREVWRNGYLFVKINDVRHDGKTTYGELCENWIPKHRYVYEQVHGKIKKGNIVVFLDSDNTNFAPENLYCIPRKVNAIMCNNGWFKTDRELTLTAIKWCELYYAMKETGAVTIG